MSVSYANIVSHFWASQKTSFGSLGTEVWEPNIYIWVFFFEGSIKFLQATKTFASCSFCLYTPFLSLTWSFFSSTYLMKLSSSKTLVTRWSVSVMIAFLFLRSKFFANISPTLLIWCEVQTRYSKILKYSEQYIGNHLSGTKVRIWFGSEYDTVFSFSCIASYNLTKILTFSSMSFLS